ncbi:hypothetical protein [Salipiger thiooxidans]|uniref:hypothetical protein n=1 Tax=Salipiger thiooxidans TaxID=282683 RepID=UPI001CD64B52|nr:hypothetical protein [Salipiger thiooxidans]MCA0851121.1 hypothetical protein [Salipiger thiooxidans]
MALHKTTPPPEQQAALDYHAYPTPGKLEIRATKPMATARDLLKAVAEGLEVGPILMGMGNRADIVTPEVTLRGLIDIATLASADVASYG